MKNSEKNSQICISIGEASVAACKAALKGLVFAEVRLDTIEDLTEKDVRAIFRRDAALIATCRKGRHSDAQRLSFLTAAADEGAVFMDLDLKEDLHKKPFKALAGKVHSIGCGLIVSYHNYEKTEETDILSKIISEALEYAPLWVKLATFTQSRDDVTTLLSMIHFHDRVIPVGMGPWGARARLMALMLEVPFTYAAYEKGKETAPGQIDRKTLEKVLKMMGLTG